MLCFLLVTNIVFEIFGLTFVNLVVDVAKLNENHVNRIVPTFAVTVLVKVYYEKMIKSGVKNILYK